MAQSQDNDPPDSIHPYREAVATAGSGFAATLWASPRTQELRFDVLTSMIGLARLQGSVILDIGCGDGALGAWLLKRGVRWKRFVGIDGVAEQIDSADARDLPDAKFVCADVLRSPRVVRESSAQFAIISGTLNTMSQPEATHLVDETFANVTDALAFNFLSDHVGAERRLAPLGPAQRHDTSAWLSHSFSMTPLVAFRQDHLDGHDGAILLRHALNTE